MPLRQQPCVFPCGSWCCRACSGVSGKSSPNAMRHGEIRCLTGRAWTNYPDLSRPLARLRASSTRYEPGPFQIRRLERSPPSRGHGLERSGVRPGTGLGTVPGQARDKNSQKNLDRLDFRVAQELLETALAADAAVLVAAVGRSLEMVADAVDPHHTGLDLAGGVERSLDVVGPHRRGQAILDPVGALARGGLVAPTEHRRHQPDTL